MQWWNDIVSWFGSRDGQLVLFSAIIPFVAILVAGIVAAAIGRGSTKRLLTLNDRENRVAAVATMIGAARRASKWNTLSAPEQQHADHVASEADVRVRLLAVPGSGLAADWAAHELSAMKRNSVSFSFQAEQSLVDFRERMVLWQAKPSRAKKLFKNDLDLWAYEDSQATKDIISQQQAWAAAQVASETGPITTVKPSQSDAEAAAKRTESFAPAAPAPVATPASASARQSAPVSAGSGTAAPTSSAPTSSAPTSTTPTSTGPSRTAAVSIAELAEKPTDDDDEHNGRERDAAPELVEPQQRTRSDDEDALDDESERRLEDAVYSPPVTANAVTKRINPPTVGDDGRKY